MDLPADYPGNAPAARLRFSRGSRMFAALCMSAVLALGCSTKAPDSSPEDPGVDEERIDPGLEYASQELIDSSFTLDFRPQIPEPEPEAERLPPDSLPSAAGSQIIGGGLRKQLTDYKTVYLDSEKEAARIAAIQEAQVKALAPVSSVSADPLTVVDWGPRGFFPSTVQRPSIYVVFSEPMVPLAALGPQSASSGVVNIEPPLRGSFRWYGTSFLSFEADEPCQAQQTYRITVNSETLSLSGKKLSGETSFSFFTEALQITRIEPGEEFRRISGTDFFYDAVPPEAAKAVSLFFNYPVTVQDIQSYLALQIEQSSQAPVDRAFTLVQRDPRKLLLQIDGEIGFETTLKITLKEGARSANSTLGTSEDAVFSFSTPGAFRVHNIEPVPAGETDRNLVYLHFNANLKTASVQNRIHTEPAMTIGPENLTVSGSTLRVHKLPVNPGDRYRITLDAGIEDIYGRKLEKPYTAEVKVPDRPPPQGKVTFPSQNYYGEKMLEAQFDPRYLFEYANVTDNSWYSLSTIKNPYREVVENTRRFTLNTEPNRRWFADMDLKPFLNTGGRGFVFFETKLELPYSSYDRSRGTFTTRTRFMESKFPLQVTDLGLTVRTGFNKTAVLVTNLSTGKALENARVRLISQAVIEGSADIQTVPFFAEGRTNQNGLALFAFEAGIYNGETRGEPVYVYAEKDGDQAVFQVRGHNTWPFNVQAGSVVRAESISPVTFLFTDRGLYKPGEILSFRGIDRSLAVGNYLIYQGGYTVSLEADSYDGDETIAVLKGETSESGGFYGSITLPDDLTPQPYRLVYRREGKSGQSANVPVTVAFFERLKFEAAITPPAGPLYAGDTVDLNLTASYLSGGGLSGAAYEEDWYRQLTWYTPPAKEAKDYYFGPRNAWEGAVNLSSRTGTLGPGGSAALTQRTAQGSVTGAAYSYMVETRVRDLSNQVISASQSVVIHPARFYLGVSSLWKRGFPKTRQELSFRFLTLRPSGERSVPADWLAQGGDAEDLTIEFFRDEWHLVQQEGVAGYVYDQYVKETITEKTQTLPLQSGGSFTFTPPKPGYYTVRLSARDAEGRRALTEYGFYVTGGGAGYWDMNSSSEIRLTPDQAVYNPGDTAQVLMQSALPGGYYLITVEREGIFSEEVRYLEEGTTVLEVPIARNYVPVVYVSVASYSVRKGPPTHEYGSPDLDKPKGYYGVAALQVNPRVRAFTIKIEDSGKRVFKPGETVTLTLRAERNGRPLPGAELTLMAVDRGVLDLINYHVPDPVNYFYGNENFPLAVRGGDSRLHLIDPVTYSIKNLAGGDSEGKIEERKDFNPTAFFEPMLKTDQDGRVKATFKLPDSLTTYRLTVVGVQGDLFALKESEIAARNQINVQSVLPRRLRERDTAEVGVLVTNLDTASHRVQVSLALSSVEGTTHNGLIKNSGSAMVDGVSERSIQLQAGESGVLYFDLAAAQEGYVNLNFTIHSDVLNERLVNELYIEKPYVMETFTTLGTVAADASSAREGLIIPGWADNGVGNLTLSLDATRLGLLDSAVDYLFHYPYGCLEQRSAAVLPLVIFGEYIDVFNLRSKVQNPKKVVEEELKSWAHVQNSNGSFPYWPGGTVANLYVSLRIAHILALAQAKQYAIPRSLDIDGLISYLDQEFRTRYRQNSGNYDYDYNSYFQAYTLYVLSLFGKAVDLSRLREIAAQPSVDAGTLAFVGMTYRSLNKESEAAAVGEKIRNLIRSTTRGADISDPREKDSRFYYAYYGNKEEQLALTLEFFVQQYPGDPLNGRLLHSLLNQRRAGGYWGSTAGTVRVLSAVDALIRADNLEQVDVEGRIALSGTELFRDRYKGLGAKPSGKSFDFKAGPLSVLSRDAILPLTVTRQGRGALYYTAVLRYAIPSELQSFRDEGLGVFVSYYDPGTDKEVEGTRLQSGKTYRARVRISSGRDRTYVALRAPIPSGAEILDTAFVSTPRYSDAAGENEYDTYDEYGDYYDYWEDPRQPSNMVIMDNEVRYFWDTFPKGEAAVQFLFRASRRGVYPTPPVQAECMYEEEIFGRTRGLLYTVE
ncbi:MAG: alpha-2-macroglobulin [Spirochaetaceae bacterium]|nr:alpha-2-macroglobulin [Spirochaetaceae bacterium]